MLNPVAMSIIRNVFVDARERAHGDRRLGRRVRGLDGARAGARRRARADQLAGAPCSSSTCPSALIAIILTAAVRARVQGRPRPPGRPGRPGAGDRRAGDADLRDHRGARAPAGPRPQTLILFGCLGRLLRRAGAVRAAPARAAGRGPLLPLAPRSPARSVTAVGVFAAVGGFLFLNTLYLQDARGLSPLDAGLYTLPMAGAMLVASPLSGRIVGSRGTRLPLVIGSVALIAVGAAADDDDVDHLRSAVLFVAYLLFGIGTGMVNPPITNTAISGMPPSQAGVAAAVASTSRQVGATLGVAVLGALAGGDAIQQLGPSFADATHTSWWVVVGIGCVLLVGAFVTTTPWALRTATQTAERLRDRDRPPAADAPGDRVAARPRCGLTGAIPSDRRWSW